MNLDNQNKDPWGGKNDAPDFDDLVKKFSSILGGKKPSSKEAAILMLADSLEAACRAIFMSEDADEGKIKNVIEEIFTEKISDGQLNNAPITFNELEIIRESFQISLEGLYHQRVLYPEITEEE